MIVDESQKRIVGPFSNLALREHAYVPRHATARTNVRCPNSER